MIAAYMEAVACDRAADRGCTGDGKGADDVGPPGEIPGGFSFSGLLAAAGPPGLGKDSLEPGKSGLLVSAYGRN